MEKAIGSVVNEILNLRQKNLQLLEYFESFIHPSFLCLCVCGVYARFKSRNNNFIFMHNIPLLQIMAYLHKRGRIGQFIDINFHCTTVFFNHYLLAYIFSKGKNYNGSWEDKEVAGFVVFLQ